MPYKDPEIRRAKAAEATARYRKRHPARVATANLIYGRTLGLLAHRARGLVSDAIRTGRLIRQSCELCGFAATEAHHPWGYDKPLSVWWLCRLHHDAMHAFIGRRQPSLVSPL